MIYFEASASTKVAKTLADETGVELAVLNPLESLTQKEQEARSEEHTSELQSRTKISYAVFCLKKKKKKK